VHSTPKARLSVALAEAGGPVTRTARAVRPATCEKPLYARHRRHVAPNHDDGKRSKRGVSPNSRLHGSVQP
jgi:hypothetical protein